MSFHQKSNPPAYEFHPELGYLFPSRELWQDVRAEFAAAAFGIIAGVAGALTLFPSPSSDLARSESALVMMRPGPVIPPSTVRDSAPLTVLIAPRAPAGATERISRGDGIVKELPPAAPTRQTVEVAQEAPPPVETPAQAIPAVTSDRGMASVPKQSRPVSRKRTRTVNSSVRRHAREPDPRAAFATSPHGDGTRNVRRRAWGGGWSW